MGWNAIVSGVVVWFLLDSGLSVVLGFAGHTLFNTAFAIALATAFAIALATALAMLRAELRSACRKRPTARELPKDPVVAPPARRLKARTRSGTSVLGFRSLRIPGHDHRVRIRVRRTGCDDSQNRAR